MDRSDEIWTTRLKIAHPDAELIDIKPCLIPATIMTIGVLTLTRRPFPVIDEFLLRSAASGISHLSKVALVLGLDSRDLISAATTLQRDGQIRLDWQLGTDGQADALLYITAKGVIAAQDFLQNTVETVEVDLLFDRLCWQLAVESPSQTLNTKSAGQSDDIKLPPLRISKPQDDDITVDALQRLAQVPLTASSQMRTILSAELISQKFAYIPADLAIYRSRTSALEFVDVWVRQRLDEVRTQALAEVGGLAALNIQIESAEPLDLTNVPEEGRRTLAFGGVDQLASDVAEKSLEIDRLSSLIGGATVDSGAPTQNHSEHEPANEITGKAAELALAQAIEQLEAAKTALAERSSTRLDTFDHPDLLRQAISRASTRLLILSPWITPAVVDDAFLLALEGRCRGGLPIHIGYGIAPEDPSDPDDNAAIRSLTSLSDLYGNFSFSRLGDTHAKVLIWDDNWVCTSFNWLSFRGDSRRKYRQEEGVLIRTPAEVDDQYVRMRDRFGETQPPSSTSSGSLTESARRILELADLGEAKTREFKASARWNIDSKARDADIEHGIVKTIAAFLNSDGGSLLIGVDDTGGVVGLHNDYKLFSRKQQNPRDSFENWLTGLVEEQLGGGTFNHWEVSFEAFPAGDVCLVSVRPSQIAVYLRRGQRGVQFFVRANNTTRELTIDQATDYMKPRFQNGLGGGRI